MSTTLSAQLSKKNSFDFLRFVFAVSVIFSHSFSLTKGANLVQPFTLAVRIYKSFGEVAVTSFFVLSGFLIARSWLQKPDIFSFFKKRVLRISPGIIVVTLVTILVLGFFSTLPYQEYIVHRQTIRYLLNFFLYPVHYNLPGIFQNNPFVYTVNGSLWSLAYEWTCYIMLAVLGRIGFLSVQRHTLLFTYLGIGFLYYLGVGKSTVILFTINISTFFSLALFFLAGTLFYRYADRITFRKRYALPCGVIFLSLLLYPPLSFVYAFVAPIVLAYVLFFISYNTPYLNSFAVKTGDLSYGLYIYAFPVQQLIISLSNNSLSVSALFAYSFLISFVLAYFSWHLVEKRFLKKRLF